MDLRITATYPATDGSMPETVELLFEGVDQEGSFDPDLLPIINQLMRVPPRTEMGRDRPAKADQPEPGPVVALWDNITMGELVASSGSNAWRLTNLPPNAKMEYVGAASAAMRAGRKIRMEGGQWVPVMGMEKA